MSLKRKSRPSISRFLAVLLRPFMSEPPPPQLPYLFFHSPDARHTENVADWNAHVLQHIDDSGENYYAKCFLRKIEYCKCSQSVEHEFLVFHFGHWINGSSAVGVVCADRTVSIHSDNSSSSSGQSSGLVSPSSADNIAHDTVTIVGSPRDATTYLTRTYGSFKILCTLRFSPSSPPSALQVSVILCLVNDHSRNYHIYERQCYWFADTAWKSLQRLFPENEELCTRHNARCRCGPFHLVPSDKSVDIVCENYGTAWSSAVEQMNQVRRHRAVEQEQLREAVRAERQREIEEIEVQVQERNQKIQECVHKIQERDRKIQERDCKIQERDRKIQERDQELEEIQSRAEQREREFEEMQRVLQAEIHRLTRRAEQAELAVTIS